MFRVHPCPLRLVDRRLLRPRWPRPAGPLSRARHLPHSMAVYETVSAQVAQIKPKLKTRPAKPKSKLPDLIQRTVRF